MIRHALHTGKVLLPFALPLLCILPPIAETASAQQQITILNAERAEGGVIEGEQVRKLIGNVELAGDRILMEADSAYQYLNLNRIDAFNIRIESENEIIWADTLFYDTHEDFSRFRGRVILQTEDLTLFSRTMDYDRTLELADFLTPVRLEDERGILLADRGRYYQNIETGSFYGNVQIADSTQYLEADSLFMNRRIDYYQLFGRVYAEEFEERVTLSGDYLEADGEGRRELEGDAWMMQVNESGSDTLHLNAVEIHLTETDTSDYLDAYGEVRIWAEHYAAIADTAHYRSDLDQFRLLSGPVIWQKRIQLTGPYIEASFEEEQIRFLSSWTRPIAVMQDSLTERFNQLRGDTLNAWFSEGEIEKILAYDNSELVYHLKNDEGEPDGLIELIAAGASAITFVEGEADRFRAERNVDGSHLPEDPENIGLELSGFRWDPELRPVRPEIRLPRLPPVGDERPVELPPRYLRYMERTVTGVR